MAVMCHVGLGCYVSASHALALIQPGSVTAKRRVDLAKKLGQYVDCSRGRGVRCYVLMDENSVIASHIAPSTLAKRFATPFTDERNVQRDPVGSQPVITFNQDDNHVPFSELYDFEAQNDDDYDEEYDNDEDDDESNLD